MLNRQQLRDYRLLRGVSTHAVATFSDMKQPNIVQIEKGQKGLTRRSHDEIVKGINAAYQAKKRGELTPGYKKRMQESDAESVQTETEIEAEE